MTLQVSPGFKTALLAAFPSIFNGGAIYVYAGVRPTTSDLPAGSLPLGVISNEGLPWNPSFTPNGLLFDAIGPYVTFAPSVSAQLVPSDEGAPTWWRLVAPGDTDDPSFTQPRIDGDIGLKSAPAGQELLLETDTLVLGESYAVGYFLYTIPPLLES